MKTILQWGSEYVVDEKKTYPCLECGKPTHFIEIFFEAPICSEECQMKADEAYMEWYEKDKEDNF